MNCNPAMIPVLAIAAGFFFLSLWLDPRLSARWRPAFYGIAALAALPGFLYTLYYLHWFDQWIWFHQLRAYPFSELPASGAGLAFGCFAAQRPSLKRAAFFGLMAWLAVPYIKPIFRPLDFQALENRWSDGICLQTSISTCGPASAATLLSHYGIAATEAELARECFTCSTGTEVWYLARALRKRGIDAVFTSSSALPPNPCMAGVDIYGTGHFITVLGKDAQGKWTVAEPLRGKRILNQSQINKRYRFTGFYLLIR